MANHPTDMCPYHITPLSFEEYKHLANNLVAQRRITHHAHGRALLRNHGAPIQKGMQQVMEVSKESYYFDIDTRQIPKLCKNHCRGLVESATMLVVQYITESIIYPYH